MVYAGQSIVALTKAVEDFTTSNKRVQKAIGEINQTFKATDEALDAKNTALGA